MCTGTMSKLSQPYRLRSMWSSGPPRRDNDSPTLAAPADSKYEMNIMVCRLVQMLAARFRLRSTLLPLRTSRPPQKVLAKVEIGTKLQSSFIIV